MTRHDTGPTLRRETGTVYDRDPMSGDAPSPATSPKAPTVGGGSCATAWTAVEVVLYLGAAGLVVTAFAAPPGLWAFPVRALPAWVFPAGLTAVLAFAAAWIRFGPPAARALAADPANPADGAGFRHRVVVGVALLGAFALLWALRCQKPYGDAGAIAGFIDRGVVFHKREPLSPALFLGVHEALGRALGWAPAQTIRVVNTVVGAVGLVVIAGLARRLLPASRGARLAGTVAIAGGGALQLLAGYVENYTVPAVLMLASLAAALDALSERRSPLWAYGLWTLSCMFHLSGLLFGPAMLWLAWHTTLAHDPRRLVSRPSLFAALVTVVPAAALFATMHAVGFLRAEEKGFGGGDGLMFVPLFERSGMSQYLFFRPAHLLAVANQQLLVAPLGLLTTLVGAALLFAQRRARAALQGPERTGLVHLVLVALAFCTLTIIWNPDLGALRDWDLFGPLGFYLNAAAVAVLATALRSDPRRLTAALCVLAAANLSRGLPFVLHNAGL
jgi:hypothetical protein